MTTPRGHEASDSYRLSRQVVPRSQTIHLKLDARRPDYSGWVRLDLNAGQPTRSFRLHSRDLRIERLMLRSGTAEIAVHHAAGERGLLTVTAENELSAGSYTLEIHFAAEFGTRASSLYRVRVGDEWYTFTQFESDDARGAFPCFDEPCFKIPFQMTLTVPREHLAIGNTPVDEETADGTWKTLAFRQTRPMPTYLLAVITGPLETVPVPGLSVPGRVVTPKGQSHLAAEAAKVTPPILMALERYFGRPYPYEKLDQIAVPEFWFGAMENPGAVTYSDAVLLMDSRAASATQRRRLVTIVAHELSHMWFGNLVTMEWWDDLWLNESFASWMGDKVCDQLYPELCIAETEVRGATRAMLTDAKLSTRAIRQPVAANDNLMQLADELAYQKGQRMLAMFERWITPERFRQGVLDYLARHEWRNATAADLWEALSHASGRDLTTAMSTFLDQGGVPLIHIEPEEGRLRVTQRRFLNHGLRESEPAIWKVPVAVRCSDGSTAELLLEDFTNFLALRGTKLEWVHPNLDAQGYYRWLIPPDMLRAMTHNAPQHLSLRERLGVLPNVSALLDAGEIHGGEFLDVVAAFAADPHPTVVAGVLDVLDKIKRAFLTAESSAPFAAFVRRILRPAVDRFGLACKHGEADAVSFLRPRLLYTLAIDGQDEEIIRHGRALADTYLADPTRVDPALPGAALCIAAFRGDTQRFAEFRRRFEGAMVPVDRQRFLHALGEFRDSRLVREALGYALSGPLRPQEIFNLPQIISSGAPENENLGFEWMTANYDAIVDRIPAEQGAYLARFADGCSLERLEAAARFFASVREKETARGIAGTERELAKVADTVRNRVSLRQREGAAVAKFLTEQA